MFHFPRTPSYEERQAYVMRKVIAEMWGLLDDGQKGRMRRSQREAAERIACGEDVPDWLETWQAPDGLAEFESVLHAVNACRLWGEKARYMLSVSYELSVPEAAGEDAVWWRIHINNADRGTVARLKDLFKHDYDIQRSVVVESVDYSLLNMEPEDFWD